jgi:hypothetical protein
LLSEKSYVTGDTIVVPEEPTKQSTTAYHYHFLGWSLDGENVVEVGTVGTEDLTYYAVFGQELRYYTIRFLNTDGTVLQTTSVAYGERPRYAGGAPIDPSGNDGEMAGWSPEIEDVTGDMDYMATYFYPPALEYSCTPNGCIVMGIGNVTDEELVIPATHQGQEVILIWGGAFKNVTTIKSVYVPDSVTDINSYAFERCTNLESVRLSENLVAISRYTFAYCSNLASITIPDSVTSIEEYAFERCTNLTSVVIGDGVEVIGKNAFGYSNLASITIPDSVTSIGTSAFTNCKNLTSVVIGNGVTSIGDKAFNQNSGITSVVIGNGVTTIGNNAFDNCVKLSSITMKPTTPPSIDVYTFRWIASDAKIIVPAGCGEAYKSATNWSNYASKIVEATE